MKKISSLLDLSFMKFFLPVVGIIPLGLENDVPFPQWIMPIYRKLSYVTIGFLVIYGSEMLVSLLFGKGNGLELSLFYLVSGINALCCIVRVVFVWIYGQEIKAVDRKLSRNFLNPMQSKARQLSTKHKIGLLNRIFYVSCAMQETISLVSIFYHAIVKHQNSHPSMFTIDASNLLIFIPYTINNFFASLLFVCGQCSFEWTFLVVIRLTAVEMHVLRLQLNAIFSSLRYDEHCEAFIRKNLCKETLYETVRTTFVKSEWQTIKEDPAYYKEKINLLDNALNEFVIHHIETIKLARTIRKIFGITIMMTYAYTVTLSTTWLLASQDLSTSFLAPFAMLALITLYLDSYCGEELVSAGCDLASDVYGMDWHLYPVGMQKKLLIILMMSQRPLLIDAHGIGPLCMSSYSAVVKFCYTLVTFFR